AIDRPGTDSLEGGKGLDLLTGGLRVLYTSARSPTNLPGASLARCPLPYRLPSALCADFHDLGQQLGEPAQQDVRPDPIVDPGIHRSQIPDQLFVAQGDVFS